jgi:hypothetical protein
VRKLQRRGATHLQIVYYSKRGLGSADSIASCGGAQVMSLAGDMPMGAREFAPGCYGAVAGYDEAVMPAELAMEHVATREELRVLHTCHAQMLAKATGVVFRRVAKTVTETNLSDTIFFPSIKLADLLVD